MKKSFALILSVALVLSAFLVSCENGETEKEKTPADTTIKIVVDGNDNVVDDPFDIDTEADE